MFSAPDDSQGVEDAKQYIERNALSRDDVRMVRTEGSICLIAKKDIEFAGRDQHIANDSFGNSGHSDSVAQ